MNAKKLHPKTLGQRIKAAREAQGKTQTAVAEALGISSVYVSQLESGERTSPRLVLLRKLAVELDVTIDHLLGG